MKNSTLLCLCLFCMNGFALSPQWSAHFDWFEYRGEDEVFKQELKAGHYFNPVIAGYYPDPSIVRVQDDYYLVNSSFGYFPGLPIFHSKDLVNWEQIGHGLTRRSQLVFENGQAMSHGIFAPTIRYHDGLFYIITTDVYGIGNFYITAEDPAGPWSRPVRLPEIGGIDPDLFFDDDGRVYIAHNERPEGKPLYQGHRAIWLWEYDLKNKKVIKESGRVIVDGGVDINKEPVWIEAPHIYKVNGWYYLSCAEGGTGDQHSQVIFRTKSLHQPFEAYANNPILTQRDLGLPRQFPVTSTGHADFVKTQNGEWWSVFLGVRPYFDPQTQKWYHNTGRETFLLPLTWEHGWPHILPAKTAVPMQHVQPNLPQAKHLRNIPQQSGNFRWRDDFDKPELKMHWLKLRTSPATWQRVDPEKTHLILQARNFSLSDKVQPTYIGRRQQHKNFRASTRLILPQSEQVEAGLALFQNSGYHYFLGVKKQGNQFQLFVEETLAGKSKILETKTLETESAALELAVEQNGAYLEFFLVRENKQKETLLDNIAASNISTQKAGGFVGVTMGPHARLAR